MTCEECTGRFSASVSLRKDAIGGRCPTRHLAAPARVLLQSKSEQTEMASLATMPFVKSVCRAMERIAPLRLAESWDNVRYKFYFHYVMSPLTSEDACGV